MSSLTLKEYYTKKQKIDKEINTLKKKLRKTSKTKTSKTIFEKNKLLSDKRRALELKHGSITKTYDDYSIVLNNKEYTIERKHYIRDSIKEEDLYNDINEIKTKIIINKFDNVFEYTDDDESIDHFKNLESEFKEKEKKYNELVQEINDEKIIKNETIKTYYDTLNLAIEEIKNELINFPKENITRENYERVADIYQEAIMPLIKNIQDLKNKIIIN